MNAAIDTAKCLIFALEPARRFGESVTTKLGLPLSPLETVEFDNGEHKSRPLVNVRGRDVYVIQSLFHDAKQSVHDKLCHLFFFLSTLRGASAAQITAVIPYLCYGRMDRQTAPREPVTSQYVAIQLEAAGADRVLAVDVHNVAAFQNAFRRPTVHLEARGLFARHFAGTLTKTEQVLVLSPDIGGIKRAEAFRETLQDLTGGIVTSGYMEKLRVDAQVTGHRVVGDVEGRTVIVYDDMICSGSTLGRAVHACRDAGAATIHAAATHPVLTPAAFPVLADDVLRSTAVSDSIPLERICAGDVPAKTEVVSLTGLFAEAIHRIHTGGSVSALNA